MCYGKEKENEKNSIFFHLVSNGTWCVVSVHILCL